MQLISVNVGKAEPIKNGGKSGMTGIFKRPVTTPVQIHTLGLEGDAIVDVENHGGEDQAVYVYGMPDYVRWSENLGRKLEPGTFGENLTISGLESATLNIGDKLHVGAVTLQVTSPRIPCSTINARMDDPQFAKKFRYAERPGAYCRVLKTGVVCAGDDVTLEPYQGEIIGVVEMFRMFFENDVEGQRRLLNVPVDIRTRRDLEST